MENLLLIASRKKLRFETKQGLLAVEDLWDLPLTCSNGKKANLDDIAIELDKWIKESSSVSFVNKSAKKEENSILKVKFDIVLQIIEIKQKEAEEAEQKETRKETKQKLLAIIEQKENEALAGKTVDELKEMIKEL